MTDDSFEYRNEALEGAKELENHLSWLETFTPAALGILATASGIYTYLGVTTLLDNTGALSVIAAVAYSTAVSVGIFVFWSYLLRLLPSMRSAQGYLGLSLAGLIGSLAIVAMSSWLNATALAGAAAIEQHLGKIIENYTEELEQTHKMVMDAQALEDNLENSANSFGKLAEQERSGNLSGKGGAGSIYSVLLSKAKEFQSIRESIDSKNTFIEEEFKKGNKIISKMQTLKSASGSVEKRIIKFSEQAINLSGVITNLRQTSAAPLVFRAMDDIAIIIKPGLDGRTEEFKETQDQMIKTVEEKVLNTAEKLKAAAKEIMDRENPQRTSFTSISRADAVIRYADNFYPQWAGAIAIDLLPAILVFILAITQSVIRKGRSGTRVEERITLSELKVAMRAIKDVEGNLSKEKPASKK